MNGFDSRESNGAWQSADDPNAEGSVPVPPQPGGQGDAEQLPDGEALPPGDPQAAGQQEQSTDPFAPPARPAPKPIGPGGAGVVPAEAMAGLTVQVVNYYAPEPVYLAVETEFGVQRVDERIGRFVQGGPRSQAVPAGTPVFISGDGCRTYRPIYLAVYEIQRCVESRTVNCNGCEQLVDSREYVNPIQICSGCEEIAMEPGKEYYFVVDVPGGRDLTPLERSRARQIGRQVDGAVYGPSPEQFGPGQFGAEQYGPEQYGAEPYGPGQYGPGQFGPQQDGMPLPDGRTFRR
jgi:hypothetical protein